MTKTGSGMNNELVIQEAHCDTNFDRLSFWRKVRGLGAAAGFMVLEKALTLYCAFRDADTPRWAKAVVMAALAYFVLPFDAVPDFIPGVGYVDDAGVLAAALAAIASNVKQSHRDQARQWAM